MPNRNIPRHEFPRQPDDARPAPPQASALPPTPPTSLPSANSLPAPIAATSVPAPDPTTKPHHAQVILSNGLIDVRADNSSLNQILRSISRATGLKITGGVQDQRVFGNYGPASTAEILATLLDGTGTNILFLAGDATTPPELVLTSRGGGPTPPNPNAPGFEDDPADVISQPAPAARTEIQPALKPAQANQAVTPNQLPQVSGPQAIPPPQNNVLGSDQNVTPTASQIPTTNSVPIDALPSPSTTTSGTGGQGIVDTPNPPAPDSTTGSTPSTAESIYQQLLQMQQKKQQQQTPPAASPAPAPAPQ